MAEDKQLTDTHKIVVAFVLNIAAGLSTCIGGLVIFNKRLVYLAKPSRLAIALGLSAGVMVFISFVEIYHESVKKFEEHFGDQNKTCDQKCDQKCSGHSQLLATLLFILGAVIIFIMDFIIHQISPGAEHELKMEDFNALQPLSQNNSNHASDAVESRIPGDKSNELQNAATKRKLNRMGVLTALAIILHNIPEGIATFVGAIDDPKFGAMLAVGIALHNIPEGVAVATPVYFATESRVKAFLWTFVSALAEPLGGIICWLILTVTKDKTKTESPMVNGILFGLVAGMMVTISIKELIPTAYRCCQSKEKVTYSILLGMLIMALSLILFGYAGV